MYLLKSKKELIIFLVVLIALTLAIIVNTKEPVLCVLENTWISTILSANSTASVIISNICCSIVAAYVFYVFIDLIPRSKKEYNTKKVLHSLLVSIFYSYEKQNIFGHEVEISAFPEEYLSNARISSLKNQQHKYLNLKCSIEVSDSRLNDFQQSLTLANNISSSHAWQWLVITDKVRLMADLLKNLPSIKDEELHLINKDSQENPHFAFKTAMNQRFNELCVETIKWLAIYD